MPSKKNQDHEHAGVAIAMHQEWLNNPEEVKEISGRLMTAKLKGAGGAITFLSAYAPTAESNEQEQDSFYDDLAAATEEEKGRLQRQTLRETVA